MFNKRIIKGLVLKHDFFVFSDEFKSSITCPVLPWSLKYNILQHVDIYFPVTAPFLQHILKRKKVCVCSQTSAVWLWERVVPINIHRLNCQRSKGKGSINYVWGWIFLSKVGEKQFSVIIIFKALGPGSFPSVAWTFFLSYFLFFFHLCGGNNGPIFPFFCIVMENINKLAFKGPLWAPQRLL